MKVRDLKQNKYQNPEKEDFDVQTAPLKRHLRMDLPSFPLLLRMSFPATIANLSTSVAVLADAVFLSRMGTAYSGAAGVLFPIFALIQAIGFTLGTGAGSILSRSLGAKDFKRANAVASFSFFASLTVGGLICLIGLLSREPLLRLLGANDEILAGALPYASVLFFASPLMCASFVLSNLLRAEGNVIWATVGTVVGNLLNILLTPLFLFCLHSGAKGVAWSLLIGYAASFVLLRIPYRIGKSAVSIRLERSAFTFRITKETLVVGSSSFARQGLAMLAAVFLNRAARQYGAAVIAALAVENRIFLFLYAFCLGIGQGMIPIVGYLSGEGRNDRAKKVYRTAVWFSLSLLSILSLVSGIFAPQILALFQSDPEVIRWGTFLLRAQCVVMPLHGLITTANLYYQTIGSARKALLIAVSRQGIFFFPLLAVLPKFGLPCLLLVQPVADGLSLLPVLIFAAKEGHFPFVPKRKCPPSVSS